MKRRRTVWHRLDPQFVAAVRARQREDWSRVSTMRDLRAMPWSHFGQIYAGADGGCNVVARPSSPEARRLQKLADAIGYHGSILGEVIE